jgi:hypothetical protein
MGQMELIALGVDQDTKAPLVVLGERAGQRRLLPIWIGAPEASTIELERHHVHTPRPLTHHLLGSIVAAFDRRLEQVRITSLCDGQFHAELVFDSDTRVSCRASDAIAIGLHLRVPIHADDTLLDHAGLPNAHLNDTTATQPPAGLGARAGELTKFRQFLDTVSPEDFRAH